MKFSNKKTGLLLFVLLFFSSSFFLIRNNISKLFAGSSQIWIDSFEYQKENTFPRGWLVKEKAGKKIYLVVSENGNKFLQAKAKNISITIGNSRKVDIVQYPFLNWKWRVHTLPPGGNEGVKAKCDQAAAIYVLLGRYPPKSIKYSWSTTLSVGTKTSSPFAVWPVKSDILILESGASKQGRWVYEKRNVLKDYKKFYDEDNPDSVIIEGIGLLTDADNTHSYSAADYDNIYFSKE